MQTKLRRFPIAIAAAASAVAFYMGTVTFFSCISNPMAERSLWIAIPSGLVAVLLPVIVLPRVTTQKRAMALCLGVSPPLAIVNSMLDYALMVILEGPSTETWWGVLGAMVVVVFCSGFLSVPAWLVGAFIVSLQLVFIHPLVRNPARDVSIPSMKITGIWLVLAALPAMFLDRFGPWDLTPETPAESSPVTWAIIPISIVIALGVACYVAGVVLSRKRRRWVERVREGAVPGWQVVPRSESHLDLSQTPPLFPGGDAGPDVIVRERPKSSGGAYRSEDRDEPWAIV